MYIIPSLPQFEPIDHKDKTTFYVGPLLIESEQYDLRKIIKEYQKEKQLIYITIGGGAGTVGNREFFNKILPSFPFSIPIIA